MPCTDKSLHKLRIPSDGRVISSLRLTGTTISSCIIGSADDVADRDAMVSLRQLSLSDCVARACYLYDCIVDEVTIDGLEVAGPAVMLEGCLLRRVTFTRVAGRFIVSPRGYGGKNIDARFKEDYLNTNDFAADVSGVWGPFDLRHVPPAAVIIDPGHQGFVDTAKIRKTPGWEDYLRENYFYRDIAGAVYVRDPYVLVSAPQAERSLTSAQESLKQLHRFGLLMPTFQQR